MLPARVPVTEVQDDVDLADLTVITDLGHQEIGSYWGPDDKARKESEVETDFPVHYV